MTDKEVAILCEKVNKDWNEGFEKALATVSVYLNKDVTFLTKYVTIELTLACAVKELAKILINEGKAAEITKLDRARKIISAIHGGWE